MIQVDRPIALVVTLLVLGGAALVLDPGLVAGGDESTEPDRVETPDAGSIDAQQRIQNKSERFPRAGRIVEPTGFINADNVSIQEHVGERVILVEFWTYSCHNCQAVTPYIKEWHREYRDDGLTVITIHSPEFDFEKRRENVVEAVREANITYPVVMDNDFATWEAWDQRYWPTRYVIGIDGYVRYKHVGEGAYDETERVIQRLLAERRAVLNGSDAPNGSVPGDGR